MGPPRTAKKKVFHRLDYKNAFPTCCLINASCFKGLLALT